MLIGLGLAQTKALASLQAVAQEMVEVRVVKEVLMIMMTLLDQHMVQLKFQKV